MQAAQNWKKPLPGLLSLQLPTQPPAKGSARAKEAEGGAAAGGPSREQLKADLDELVAAECVYCGELMIRSIDRPFIDPQRYEEEHLSWL